MEVSVAAAMSHTLETLIDACTDDFECAIRFSCHGVSCFVETAQKRIFFP